MRHCFTVDVEEYFQVSALEPHVDPRSWDGIASRIERPIGQLLELLARFDTRATFFVLGWVADRHPRLAPRIASAGHEIASHGWDHRRVTHQTPAEFRDSVRRTRRLLEDQTGVAVAGFRAPSFSIVPGREWALDLLLEEGHRYDSSLFPVRRPGYGYPAAQRDPHWIARPAGSIWEVPPTTWRVGPLNLPAAGGGYFRLLPYELTRRALRQCAARRRPGVFYIHPWELDPEQPRLALGALTRVRHYGGLARVAARLERLLAEFRFDAIQHAAPPAVLTLEESPPVAPALHRTV